VADIWIKICGVTTPEDAEMVAEAGADAIGLNFVPSSPRVVSEERARSIAQAVRGRVEIVGVFANRTPEEMRDVAERVGLDWVQLHGDESPDTLAAASRMRQGLGAMKAVRVGQAADVEQARRFAGERLLVDALVRGALGGTGHAFDWSLVVALARERSLVLAGGLRPDNVARAVLQVRPFGVDTASGVEHMPGQKSAAATRAFVAGARAAAAALRDQG
jgi:phosphoribosylanthranilate isomerase